MKIEPQRLDEIEQSAHAHLLGLHEMRELVRGYRAALATLAASQARRIGADGEPRANDAVLLGLAVRNTGRGRPLAARWTHVEDALAVSSTHARELCERYGLDPDDLVGESSEHRYEVQ